MQLEAGETDVAIFKPFEGAKVLGRGAKLWDIFIRKPGQVGWHYGTTCDNAAMAMTCQNFVRRTYNGTVLVKYETKPAY